MAVTQGRYASGSSDRVFVWLVWACAVAAAFYFVHKYAVNRPRGDDNAVMGQLIGTTPVTAQWLWEPFNEHRIPLVKLLLIATYRLAGNDLRGTMYFSTILFSLCTAALIRATGIARGSTSYTDAFFPLMLLHWGHVDCITWAFVLGFSLGMSLIYIAVANIIAHPVPTAANAVAIGVCLVGALFCGANGALLAAPLAVWLFCCGGADLKNRRMHAIVGGITLVIIGLSYSPALFNRQGPAGYQKDVGEIARGAAEFLTTCWGLMLEKVAHGWVTAAVIFYALTTIFVLYGFATLREDRWRAAALFCLLAGLGFMAVGVGFGRAIIGMGDCLEARYVSLATLLPCVAYLAACLRWPETLGHYARVLLMLLALGIYVRNIPPARLYAATMYQLPSPHVEGAGL
jgi:hypothetical protein